MQTFEKQCSLAVMRRLHLLTLAWAVLPLLVPGDAQARPACPKPATQADVLNYDLAGQKRLKLTGRLREAVTKVYACHPPHPVLGGPARIAFKNATAAPNGRGFLRFKVAGLSDMYLAYLVDGRGNLMRAFVTGP